MKKVTKQELADRLILDYNIVVSTKQITLTKTSINNVMIVEGIGGYGFFRYGIGIDGELKIYPNKMHEVNYTETIV